MDQTQIMETESQGSMGEGVQAVSQLAQKVQGAGVKGWRTMASLFNKEDEDRLLPPELIPDHPLAVKPEEPPKEKKLGLWDVFATKLQQPLQTSVNRNGAQSEYTENMADSNSVPQEHLNDDAYSSNVNEIPEPTEIPFKWGFLTSKLVELKNKTTPKND